MRTQRCCVGRPRRLASSYRASLWLFGLSLFAGLLWFVLSAPLVRQELVYR